MRVDILILQGSTGQTVLITIMVNVDKRKSESNFPSILTYEYNVKCTEKILEYPPMCNSCILSILRYIQKQGTFITLLKDLTSCVR